MERDFEGLAEKLAGLPLYETPDGQFYSVGLSPELMGMVIYSLRLVHQVQQMEQAAKEAHSLAIN